MTLHACPDWVTEPDDKLPPIARGLNDYYQFLRRKAKTYKLNANDIKMWHGKIFALAVPLAYYAGNFRGEDPSRPCLGRDVGVGGRSGAPFAEVRGLMDQFSEEMTALTERTDEYAARTNNTSDRLKAAVHLAAFCEGRIIQIHPFLNGNGRMSRLAADYFLYRYGFPFAYYPPFARPGLDYGSACAECMLSNYSLLYEYLLRVAVKKVVELAGQ
jgi:hypothetical protein